MIDQSKLTRKERRALEFAGANTAAQEQHAEGSASLQKKLNRFEIGTIQVAKDGSIYIPEIRDSFHLRVTTDGMMIPYKDLDDVYKSKGWNVPREVCGGDTPVVFTQFVNNWFFRGIKKVEFVFRDNVKTVDGYIDHLALRRALLKYISQIMNSFEPSHEHKIAYVTYCLHTCCSSVVWEVSEEQEPEREREAQ